MKNQLFFLLATLAVATYSEEDKCEAVRQLNENSGILPITLESGVRLSKTQVDCEQWKLSQNIYLPSASKMLQLSREQWAFEQEQWVTAQCGPKGMSSHGWVYEKKYYDENKAFVGSILATPEMCSRAVIH